MKGSTKAIIGAVIGVGIIVGGIVGYKMWNQPHRDINDEKADFQTTSVELASEFQKDAKSANTKYHEKVVELKGKVTQIVPGDSLTSITLAGNDAYTTTCEMLPGTNDAVSKVKKDDEITIKAFFMGFMEGEVDFGMPGDILFKKGVLPQ